MTPTPEVILAARERVASLRSAIALLRRDGASTREIAEYLGVTQRTVTDVEGSK
jgi:DNA-binding CsgD family transcriptional regulator